MKRETKSPLIVGDFKTSLSETKQLGRRLTITTARKQRGNLNNNQTQTSISTTLRAQQQNTL
jgi:hypothetical protein